MATSDPSRGEFPYEPQVVRYERGTIPVIARASLPNVIDDDGLVERLDAVRERFPFAMFEGNPAIHFFRWNDVREIFRNWPHFSSARKNEDVKNFRPSNEVALIPSGYDPPQAQIYRAIMQSKFSDIHAAAFEPLARERAISLIEGFAAEGSCEYMEEFAGQFFGPILLTTAGIPERDVDYIQMLEQNTFLAPEDDPGAKIQHKSAEDLSAYLTNLVREARANLPAAEQRGDDLLTHMLTQSLSDGRLMTDEEVKSALQILCLAGAHSVKAALGYAMKLLADRPELRRELLDADGNAAPHKIEELLRWNGVGGGLVYRRVTGDMELSGCPLRADDVVAPVMTSANHDPDADDSADALRFDRERVRSFTFAFGVHRCLGIHFARMGLKVAMEEWHRRIPDYAVDQAAPLREQVWAGVGYYQLPLVWDGGGVTIARPALARG